MTGIAYAKKEVGVEGLGLSVYVGPEVVVGQTKLTNRCDQQAAPEQEPQWPGLSRFAVSAKQARRDPQKGIDKKQQVRQKQRTRIKDDESHVRGQQDHDRHEETARRTRPPHCLPRKNQSISNPRSLLRRAELWQTAFCLTVSIDPLSP